MVATIFGMLLIAAGALLLADRLGYLDFGRFVSTWWPSLIILVGLGSLRRTPTRIQGIVLIVAGGLWQLGRLDLLPLEIAPALWPLALILLGLLLIVQEARSRSPVRQQSPTFESLVLFGSRTHTVNTPNVRSARFITVFSEADLDLRQAGLDPQGAYIEVISLFSEVNVIVPPSWQVELKTAALLAEVRDRRTPGVPEPNAGEQAAAGSGPDGDTAGLNPVVTVGGTALLSDVALRC